MAIERSSVWIAGVGAVSSAGSDVSSTLDSFWNGRRNPAATLPFESSISCPTFQVSGELPTLPPAMNRSRSLRLAMKAVREALGEAGIAEFGDLRVGVCIGTTVASQLNSIPFYDAYRREGNPPLEAVYDYLRANLAQAVGELLGARGPCMTIVNACSSGTDAIGVAAGWIRAGLCDVAVAGGAISLTSAGTIVQTGGVIEARTLTGSSVDGAGFQDANLIDTLSGFTNRNSGAFSLTNAKALTVGGVIDNTAGAAGGADRDIGVTLTAGSLTGAGAFLAGRDVKLRYKQRPLRYITVNAGDPLGVIEPV